MCKTININIDNHVSYPVFGCCIQKKNRLFQLDIHLFLLCQIKGGSSYVRKIDLIK